MNFKQFSPLSKLNMSLIRSEVFEDTRKDPFRDNPRYRRFAACMESFDRNLLTLDYVLDRIAGHLNITYHKNDRQQSGEYKIVKNTILLGIDLAMFFITTKILLDDIAFFTPFYYKDPIMIGGKDIRDSEWPWDFRSMKSYFIQKNPDLDKEFAKLLSASSGWTDYICDIRKFLVHRFHDLVIGQDYWTNTCFAFLYEFNKKKDFIPDILSYIAKTYFKLTKFLTGCEMFFKNKCEAQFPSFSYFHEGSTFANALNKRHLFFAAFGRILTNKILIKIHPNRRNTIPGILEDIMRQEQCSCDKCNSFDIQIKPTLNEFILISAKCTCGNILTIPLIVEKKFFPYFMDKNRREHFWGLLPYTLDKLG